MKTPVPVILILGVGVFRAFSFAAPPNVSEEVSVGFLPLEWVTATLKKTLSPEGRYKFLSASGPVRISDCGEKIDDTRRTLEELQKAAAIVPVEINFITVTSRAVQRALVSPPARSDGIRVPSHYSPPRVMAGPGGSMVAIPSQPRFTKAPKAPAETSVTSQVRQSETSITRRCFASVAVGKPVALTVLAKAPDAAALHTLALNLHAIPESEPAWTAAGTELLLQTELSDGALLLKIVPQIVVPDAAPGHTARHIALSTCAGSVLIARGVPINTGTLPHTDAEFYRLFLGAPQLEKDSLNALRVSAAVHYIGDPPK